MKPLFSSFLIKRLLIILFSLLLAKLLWFVIGLSFFSTQGVDHAVQKQIKPLYYRVRLTSDSLPKFRPKLPKKSIGSIRDIVLLGIYHASDTTVVTVKYRGKSKVLGRGEAVNGFVLDRAANTYAIFTKGSKEYKVTLFHAKESVANSRSIFVHKAYKKQTEPLGEITDVKDDMKIIDRSLLEHYTQNMDDIFKNIGIMEIRKHDGTIKGFRVTFVKKGTPFAKLGLKRHDVLKSINGRSLDSYKAAFDAYKDAKNATDLTLTIQRGNIEMELEYEIN
ncbi:MAG: PDZ domain-containing protein [Sulfurovum sp.]|nr:PDZ domain-containing protein [Sulfurovum sp.]